MLGHTDELDLLIADLLMMAGMVKPVDVDRAWAARRDCRVPIGELFLESDCVRPRHLAEATFLAREVKKGALGKQDARNALYLIGNCSMNPDEAYRKLGIKGGQLENPWASQLKLLAIDDKWVS